MQDILKFKPIYKDKIWGGRKLENLGRVIPSGKIGESWEISDFGNDLSVIDNGELKGITLRECFKNYKKEIFGESFIEDESFPLLVKIIDAEDKLSVQVHPDDEFSKNHDPENKGKKEAWFILKANPSAEIVCGFSKDISAEEYRYLIENNKAEEPLFYRNIQSGDIFLIDPGTVHAIGPGCLILEVQQSSDSTYRVYDYGRLGNDGRPRELHLEKALRVLNFSKSDGREKLEPIHISSNFYNRYLLTSNDKFRMEKISFNNECIIPNMFKKPAFHIISVIHGEIKIDDFILTTGDTILVSAKGILNQIKCSTKEKSEFALIGCGTNWLEPNEF